MGEFGNYLVVTHEIPEQSCEGCRRLMAEIVAEYLDRLNERLVGETIFPGRGGGSAFRYVPRDPPPWTYEEANPKADVFSRLKDWDFEIRGWYSSPDPSSIDPDLPEWAEGRTEDGVPFRMEGSRRVGAYGQDIDAMT